MFTNLTNSLHVSIDIETLGLNTSAPILSCAIVPFTLAKGIDTERTRYVQIGFDNCFKNGHPDASTLSWWLAQPEAIRTQEFYPTNALTAEEGAKALASTLHSFTEEYGEHIMYWAHASFDFPLLENYFKRNNVRYKFPFRQVRDLRTLEALMGDTIVWPSREGHHTAIGDAMYQAVVIENMLNNFINYYRG